MIGLTTTVPIEVIFAAGRTPVDLNNRFITADNPQALAHRAELEGLPHNLCGWIKGLYAVGVTSPAMDTVVAVTQGDCSNTHALMELFERAGKTVIPFAYPYDADRDLLRLQIEKFITRLGPSLDDVAAAKRRLDDVRRKLLRLDRMTWRDGLITGGENHLWLVSASDMNGDVDRFESELDAFLDQAASRRPMTQTIRLGYLGVPPIFSDLYTFLESHGARVVFNEMQRQFAMVQGIGRQECLPHHPGVRTSPSDRDRGGRTFPSDGTGRNACPPGAAVVDVLVEQYGSYTYPYRVWGRIDDIKRAVAERALDGLIHYVQSFCFRAMEDVILREALDVPVLTLEGDLPGPLDARSQVRLESFLESLV